MRNEDLEYKSDGVAMHGRLYWDETRKDRRPGVLVCPEGTGISNHTYGFAQRLAEQGYVALACDYYGGAHRSAVGFDEKTGKMLQEISSPERMRARAQGSYDALTARPEVDKSRIAIIGYCFGGTMALEFALSGAPVAAAVGFHSGLGGVTTADAMKVRARLLICLGTDDPWVPAEQRAKFEADLKGTGVRWQMNLYGGQVHSFTNPDAGKLGDAAAARYDEWSNQESWDAMLRLFKDAMD